MADYKQELRDNNLLTSFTSNPKTYAYIYGNDTLIMNLATKFIFPIHENNRNNWTEIFNQIQLAFWDYIEFITSDSYGKVKCNEKIWEHMQQSEFAKLICKAVPFLSHNTEEEILVQWKKWYEDRKIIKACGAILLNQGSRGIKPSSKVLLVQDAKDNWSFPKGKIEIN